MDRIRKRSFLLIGSIAVLTALLLVWFSAARNDHRHGVKFSRILQFSKIRIALQKFAWDHDDQLPATLSELAPHYITADQLSDCIYVGAAGISREVIAYERKTAQNLPTGKRQIIDPMFGVDEVSASELEQLLHQDHSAVLDRLRKERVIYYEANLHASLNCYRMTFGSYPRGNNLSVTDALRGQNAKMERFHSSYPQERTPTGEDLDPWGTPYWIESDGNRVRVKSAAFNRQCDQPTSSQYDDICFTITNGSAIGDDTKF